MLAHWKTCVGVAALLLTTGGAFAQSPARVYPVGRRCLYTRSLHREGREDLVCVCDGQDS